MYPKLPKKYVSPLTFDTSNAVQDTKCDDIGTASMEAFLAPLTRRPDPEFLERQPIFINHRVVRSRRLKTSNLLTICKVLAVFIFSVCLLTTSAGAWYIGYKVYREVDHQIAPIAELAAVQRGDLAPEKAVVVRGLFGGLMDVMRATGANIPPPPAGKSSWSKQMVDTSDFASGRSPQG